MENTTNTTKVTKRERFAQLMAIVENAEVENREDLMSFINHEVELLDKKNSRSGKPTKTQVLNEELKAIILEVLERENKPMTVTQLLAEEELATLSNQKVSALLTQLRKETLVVRIVEKKTSFYSLNANTEAEEVEADAEEMGE